jgi:hypothetical protein
MRESEKAATAITSDSVATGSRANWNPRPEAPLERRGRDHRGVGSGHHAGEQPEERPEQQEIDHRWRGSCAWSGIVEPPDIRARRARGSDHEHR